MGRCAVCLWMCCGSRNKTHGDWLWLRGHSRSTCRAEIEERCAVGIHQVLHPWLCFQESMSIYVEVTSVWHTLKRAVLTRQCRIGTTFRLPCPFAFVCWCKPYLEGAVTIPESRAADDGACGGVGKCDIHLHRCCTCGGIVGGGLKCQLCHTPSLYALVVGKC